MKSLHPLQLEILQKLLFSTSLRFTDLRPNEEVENNQLDFHLHKLIELSYVEKRGLGYGLTSLGKEYAGRIDTSNRLITRQGKIGVIIGCIRERNGENEFLFYTRLKQPFFECQGFPTGKIQFGESIVETAERELFEETGLTGKASVIQLTHYRVRAIGTSELLEDKYLFLCKVSEPEGELIERSEEGLYYWVKESEVETVITNPFDPIDEYPRGIELLKKDNPMVEIIEIEHEGKKF